MNKLLRAGMRRYARSSIFWLAILITIIVAAICGYDTRGFYLNDIYIIIALVANAVLISWLVGREYEEGIFRNKVISGHPKGRIFLSELILGVGICVALYLLFAFIFLCFNSYILGVAPTAPVIKMFIGCLLVTACFSALLVTVSCLVSHRAVIAIVNILLVFGIAFASYGLQRVAEQEEYWAEYDYEYVTEFDENGNPYEVGYAIEGSERLVKNPDYIDGPIRDICEIAYRVLPYGHITQYVSLTNDWFGYDNYDNWTAVKNLAVTSKDDLNININLIYAAIEFIAICSIGYFSFRRKEIK